MFEAQSTREGLLPFGPIITLTDSSQTFTDRNMKLLVVPEVYYYFKLVLTFFVACSEYEIPITLCTYSQST